MTGLRLFGENIKKNVLGGLAGYIIVATLEKSVLSGLEYE
jgi:hypothetical protein